MGLWKNYITTKPEVTIKMVTKKKVVKKKLVKKEVEKKKIVVEGLNLQTIKLNIVGKRPLLMDKFTDAAKDAILDKQMGISKSNKKRTRVIQTEIDSAIHKTSTGKVGFPEVGFKRGMMECTSFIGDKFFSKKLIQGAVQIMNAQDGLILIKSKKQDVLKHNIQHNIKFTPQFHDWSCELVISYDANTIAPTDIIKLLDYAGHYVGIGAWRPKSGGGGSGTYGMYEVKKKK